MKCELIFDTLFVPILQSPQIWIFRFILTCTDCIISAPCAMTSFMANPVYTPGEEMSITDPSGNHHDVGTEIRPGQPGAIIQVPNGPNEEASINIALVNPINTAGNLEVIQIHVR